MSDARPLVVRGGRVVDPSQDLDANVDLLLQDGVVAGLGDGIDAPDGAEEVDASGLVVCPGLIDIHVHLREPGQEHKETVRTGTMAAAAGGFTAVVSMANTDPVNDDAAVTELILSQARRAGFARVFPLGTVSKGMKGEAMAEMGEMVASGAVGFSDDGVVVAHPELMRRALLYTQHYGVPVAQHAEDLRLTGDGVMHEGEWSTKLGLKGIPRSAEDVIIARDLILLAETGGRYHVQHLSTAGGVELMRAAKERGLPATCEVTPHHLFLTDQAIADSGLFDRLQDEAAAAGGVRPAGAARGAHRRHHRLHRQRPRAPPPGREGRGVLGGALRHPGARDDRAPLPRPAGPRRRAVALPGDRPACRPSRPG